VNNSNRPVRVDTFLNWPCGLTGASLAGGFLALILASDGELAWAAGVVVVCGVLDSFDGLLARRLSVSSPFGEQLDSLSDIVAFGVVPALMMYVALESAQVVGAATAVVFVLCGAWRLARFALLEDRHSFFLGLPIPPAGVITSIAAALTLPTPVAVALTLALSVLMISDLPFPTFGTIGRLLRRNRAVEEEPALVTPVDLDRNAA
jgi:CDP-diacylglycerol---serine O-phosphatidyltransferase